MIVINLVIDGKCVAIIDASDISGVEESFNHDAQLNYLQSLKGFAFSVFLKNGFSPIVFFVKTEIERILFSSKIKQVLSGSNVQNVVIELDGNLNQHMTQDGLLNKI